MNRKELVEQIFAKKSFLCVGLDTDLKKVPAHILKEEDPIFAFNKAIIDATAPYCVSYKPNLAFRCEGSHRLREDHQILEGELSEAFHHCRRKTRRHR